MSYYKSLFKNYIVLIALIVFAVVYIIINFDAVKQGDIYNGDLTKSFLITGIIVLLSYLFVTWDDDKETTEYNDITTNYNDNNNDNNFDIDKKDFNMNGGLYSHEPFGIKKFIKFIKIKIISKFNMIKIIFIKITCAFTRN
jgi:amino acid permease